MPGIVHADHRNSWICFCSVGAPGFPWVDSSASHPKVVCFHSEDIRLVHCIERDFRALHRDEDILPFYVHMPGPREVHNQHTMHLIVSCNALSNICLDTVSRVITAIRTISYALSELLRPSPSQFTRVKVLCHIVLLGVLAPAGYVVHSRLGSISFWSSTQCSRLKQTT